MKPTQIGKTLKTTRRYRLHVDVGVVRARIGLGKRKPEAVAAIFLVCVAGAGCRARETDYMQTTDQNEKAISLLRQAYAAFNRGDIAAAVEQLDPQIEWTEPREFPGGGTYQGRSEVARYLTQSRAGWDAGRSEPERFIVAGDRVVVFVHARFRLHGGSEWRDLKLADVYTFRGGRPVQMRAFADQNDALRWVGVRELNR